MKPSAGNPQFALYLPRVLLEWQSQEDPGRFIEVEGTLLMADISGFTRLSEELAHKGKVGSEEVTRVLNGAFSELLDVASLDGGDLLKFGGDALLHLFVGDDHAARAARSAFDMRDVLEEFQEKKSPVPLKMSMGMASGLGDVCDRAGLHERAREAYEQAVELSGDTPLLDGRLLRKQAMVREKVAEYEPALELVQQALDRLNAAEPSPERSTERLEAMVMYAGVLNRQGDREGSAGWCRKVIESSDGDEDPTALAHAYNLLETNYTDLNHPDRGKFYEKALEIYEETKDLVGQAKVLNNIGYNMYFLGDWVKASEYWQQSEVASTKAGDVVTAAMVMHNIGEIDVDRGLLTEARKKLRNALRIWQGAGYAGGVAYAKMNLGRLESRAGNRDAAQQYLTEAVESFTAVGDQLTVLEARTRLIADHLRYGETDEALAMIATDLDQADELEGAVVQRGSLRRLRGYAHLQHGDTEASRSDLDESLRLTREAKARFEEGLTLLALSSWASATGNGDEWGESAQAIFDELGVENAAHLDITEAPDAEAEDA